eukprot:6874970-Alexandrium_andersonii.AAC.1
MADTSHALLSQVRRAVAIMEEVRAAHALKLHYMPRKTAGLLALRGAGSKEVRRELYSTQEPTISCPTRHGVRYLPVVA